MFNFFISEAFNSLLISSSVSLGPTHFWVQSKVNILSWVGHQHFIADVLELLGLRPLHPISGITPSWWLYWYIELLNSYLVSNWVVLVLPSEFFFSYLKCLFIFPSRSGLGFGLTMSGDIVDLMSPGWLSFEICSRQKTTQLRPWQLNAGLQAFRPVWTSQPYSSLDVWSW